MTFDTTLQADTDLGAAIADEYCTLADLLEASEPAVWTHRRCARAGAPGRWWPT